MRFRFRQVDVFTAVPLAGNPLAVVLGADALTAAEMAAVANWTNLSESTFLLAPTTAYAFSPPPANCRLSATPPWEAAMRGWPKVGCPEANR
jgi:PhzF family phenazine biosynthesis protein